MEICHAVRTDLRSLEEAMKGADVFLGVSVKGAVTAPNGGEHGRQPGDLRHGEPLIPRSRPKRPIAVRIDAIVATGRSDYPNQVNNVPRISPISSAARSISTPARSTTR